MYYVVWSLGLMSVGAGLVWNNFSTHSGLELGIGLIVASRWAVVVAAPVERLKDDRQALGAEPTCFGPSAWGDHALATPMRGKVSRRPRTRGN
jgi:hypothetical protein